MTKLRKRIRDESAYLYYQTIAEIHIFCNYIGRESEPMASGTPTAIAANRLTRLYVGGFGFGDQFGILVVASRTEHQKL